RSRTRCAPPIFESNRLGIEEEEGLLVFCPWSLVGEHGRPRTKDQRRRTTGRGLAASDRALGDHGVGDAPESGDVGAETEVVRLAEFGGRFGGVAMRVAHDFTEPLVDGLK